jgi:non-heme chloroperoxidase
MEHALSNDVTLHVVDEGDGPPIAFVHGVMMSGRFFAQQTALRVTHRVVVPDLRGHGLSEKVLSGHTVADYAQDLGLLFEAMSLRRPLLVGWSMGRWSSPNT